MKLKYIMLSGIGQHRKENTVLSQLYVQSTKVHLIKQQNLDCQEPAAEEMGDVVQMVQKCVSAGRINCRDPSTAW